MWLRCVVTKYQQAPGPPTGPLQPATASLGQVQTAFRPTGPLLPQQGSGANGLVPRRSHAACHMYSQMRMGLCPTGPRQPATVSLDWVHAGLCVLSQKKEGAVPLPHGSSSAN